MIVLVNLPPASVETPPAGVSYLAGNLLSKVLDMNDWLYNNMEEHEKKQWDAQDATFWTQALPSHQLALQYAGFLASLKADAYGFSGNSLSIPLFRMLASGLRGYKVLGGSAALHAQGLKEADCIFVGEGEFELGSVIKKKVKGIYHAKPIEDLDAIKPPIFPAGKYVIESLPTFLARGCAMSCKFCSDRSKFRKRSVNATADEIAFLKKKYSANDFMLLDLIANGDLALLQGFSDAIAERNLKIGWTCSMTIDGRMAISYFKKLRFSGLREITFGVESFSDKVLSLMGKGYSGDDAIANITAAKSAGLQVGINLMVGFPGEERVDVYKTMEALSKIEIYVDKVSNMNVCTLQQGSELWNKKGMFSFNSQSEEGWVFRNNDRSEREWRRNFLQDHLTRFNLCPAWR